MRTLIVDDDPGIRWLLSHVLREEGHEVVEASNLEQALALQKDVELVFLDVFLPDGNGMQALREHTFSAPVVILTAETTFDHAAEAYQYGALEYLPKPFDLDEIRQLLRRMDESQENTPPPPPRSTANTSPMLGRSPAMQNLFRTLARVAASNLTVLIAGESGTGKELVARELHARSPRAQGPFVAINTAAIPSELLEAELFGHDKGAFTGADKARPGRFLQAHGGTLFLDEIGDMPLNLQSKLLRVLETGTVQAVGSGRESQVDIRLLAATHQDLAKKIRDGQFREDLYYRLNVIPVLVPPLRERPDDIAELAEHFLALAIREQACEPKVLQKDALALLQQYRWPGNVRELKNVMQRLAILTPGVSIGGNDVALALGSEERASSREDELAQVVTRYLQDYCTRMGSEKINDLYRQMEARIEPPLLRFVLRRTRGHQMRAAEMLGLNRNTLRKLLRRHDIDPSEFH